MVARRQVFGSLDLRKHDVKNEHSQQLCLRFGEGQTPRGCCRAYLPLHDLSPVHTSDADEPPTVGGTHFDAYEYLTGSYSGV